MWNKAKQEQLDKARAEVERLENELTFARSNRLDEVANILGGGKRIEVEEVYEFHKELYDLFDRWHREDNA